MNCSNATTPFLIQFALDLDYYLKQATLGNDEDSDHSMWLFDTLISALDYYAEGELEDAEKQSDLHSAIGYPTYCGGNYKQVMELKNLLARSYRKTEVQRTYDYFHQKNEKSYYSESPLDDRSEDILMTQAPDSWYEWKSIKGVTPVAPTNLIRP